MKSMKRGFLHIQKKDSILPEGIFYPEGRSWFRRLLVCHMLNMGSNTGGSPYVKENSAETQKSNGRITRITLSTC